MSCDVKSCHVMSCHVMSCDEMSCHVTSCDLMMQCDVRQRDLKKCTAYVGTRVSLGTLHTSPSRQTLRTKQKHNSAGDFIMKS